MDSKLIWRLVWTWGMVAEELGQKLCQKKYKHFVECERKTSDKWKVIRLTLKKRQIARVKKCSAQKCVQFIIGFTRATMIIHKKVGACQQNNAVYHDTKIHGISEKNINFFKRKYPNKVSKNSNHTNN